MNSETNLDLFPTRELNKKSCVGIYYWTFPSAHSLNFSTATVSNSLPFSVKTDKMQFYTMQRDLKSTFSFSKLRYLARMSLSVCPLVEGRRFWKRTACSAAGAEIFEIWERQMHSSNRKSSPGTLHFQKKSPLRGNFVLPTAPPPRAGILNSFSNSLFFLSGETPLPHPSPRSGHQNPQGNKPYSQSWRCPCRNGP